MASNSSVRRPTQRQRVLGVVGGQALGHRHAVRRADQDRVAALEGPSTAVTPAASRLLPRRRAVSAPASTASAPAAPRQAAIQALYAAAGVVRARTGCSGAAVHGRAAGARSAPGDHDWRSRRRSRCGRRRAWSPCRRCRRQRCVGAAGHGLDLGRQIASTTRQVPGGRVAARVGGVEAVDVGEQHQRRSAPIICATRAASRSLSP